MSLSLCAWFCKSMHWSFRLYCFTEVCSSSLCWHILSYSIKKITCIISTNLIRKLKSVWKLSCSWWQIIFQNSIFLWKLKLYYFNYQLSFLTWQAHLPNTEVWIIIFCFTVVTSNKIGILCKKLWIWAQNSKHMCLFLANDYYT